MCASLLESRLEDKEGEIEGGETGKDEDKEEKEEEEEGNENRATLKPEKRGNILRGIMKHENQLIKFKLG